MPVPQTDKMHDIFHWSLRSETMESKVNLNLLRKVKENIIGHNTEFHSPFGLKRLLYCDYTASGKALEYIERFIYDNVYPYYANTHTNTSVSGLQTTTFREESRDIIRKAVNAGTEDVVIFTGSGTTAAIHKIISVLDLRPPKTEHTAVIIGPYEHHSNILPWKETGVQMERVLENDNGTVDLDDLERHLRHYFHRGFWIIVTMSAASNVTGIVTDTDKITRLVHKYGGLAFWDFATAAPYIPINMNPGLDCSKDAVFISPHKFVGGVGTPGVLIAKKKLFNNQIPDKCGGGTVAWVTQQSHEYTRNIAEREEGGTPAIVESIRAGLAFQVKSLIGDEVIMKREEELCQRALNRWRGNPCLQLLGSYSATRLPIFSFLVHQPQMGKYLHHNFVSVLLNDLYGIQVRGGCACAGPYAQDLLDMDEERAMLFVNNFLSETLSDSGNAVLAIMKPGFVRLNFPYFLEDECVEFILKAVEITAREGWKLLPLYTFDPHTGQWKHRKESMHKLYHLHDASLNLPLQAPKATRPTPLKKPLTYKAILKDARRTLDNYQRLAAESDVGTEDVLSLESHDQSLLWFLQPREVYDFILKPELADSTEQSLPFRPRRRSSTYKHPPLVYIPNLQGSQEHTDDEIGQERSSDNLTDNIRVTEEATELENLSPVRQDDESQERDSKMQGEQKKSIKRDRESMNQPSNQYETDDETLTKINRVETEQQSDGNERSEEDYAITNKADGQEKLHIFLESNSSGDSAFIQSVESTEEVDHSDGFDGLFHGFSRMERNTAYRANGTHPHPKHTMHMQHDVSPILEHARSEMNSSLENSQEAEDSAFISLLKIEENHYSPIIPSKHKHTVDAATSPLCDPYALLPSIPASVPNKHNYQEAPTNKPCPKTSNLSNNDYDEPTRPPIKSLVKTLNNGTPNVGSKSEQLSQEMKCQDTTTSSDDDMPDTISKSVSLVSFKTSGGEEEHSERADSGKRKNKKRTKKQKKKKKELCTIM